MAGRLPRLGRILAALAAAALAGVLVALIMGPWLRITDVGWSGEQLTDADDLARVMKVEEGSNLLLVDTDALAARVASLPAIAEARVEALVPGALHAWVVERSADFVWRTSTQLLLADSDGTIFAAVRGSAPLPEVSATLPVIDDQRSTARLIRVGDVLPQNLAAAAAQLSAIDPAALGSTAAMVTLRVTDEHGFLLAASDPGWEIAFGLPGQRVGDGTSDLAAEITAQVGAVRTLFATKVEAGIGWVDARNPGRVYFRAKG